MFEIINLLSPLVVDSVTRDRWVEDTASYTLNRLEILQNTNPDAVIAREHYHTNIEQYKAMVMQALGSLKTVSPQISINRYRFYI